MILGLTGTDLSLFQLFQCFAGRAGSWHLSNLTAAGAYMVGGFHDVIDFVSLHPDLAYAVIFLAALLEAVPILGSLIPGSSIVLALSALIPTGGLGLAPVLGSATVGALIGDWLAYWIGRKTQRKVLTSWPLSKYPDAVAKSEGFFRRYGTLAVLLARFVPPIRAIVPVTAGALGMPPQRFYPVNTVAVLLWASVHVLSGTLAGSAAERWGPKVEHYELPLVGGIVALGCVFMIVLKRRRRPPRNPPRLPRARSR